MATLFSRAARGETAKSVGRVADEGHTKSATIDGAWRRRRTGGDCMTRTRSRKRRGTGAQKTAANGGPHFSDVDHRPLNRCVAFALDRYFESLDGAPTAGLYDLVIAEVERPLLESVMRFVDDNQTRASDVLGLNRGTLRKKLKQHGLLDG